MIRIDCFFVTIALFSYIMLSDESVFKSCPQRERKSIRLQLYRVLLAYMQYTCFRVTELKTKQSSKFWQKEDR